MLEGGIEAFSGLLRVSPAQRISTLVEERGALRKQCLGNEDNKHRSTEG